MTLAETLLSLERELATGHGDAYERLLTDDAAVVVPGQALDKRATVDAIAASPGWDEVALEDERAIELAPDAALLTYRFRGRRGGDVYSALMGSAWVKRDGAWRLAYHQQTPLG